MVDIVLLATAWGPKYGGINAFNRDFSIGLAKELANVGRVFCAVPDPTEGDIADAQHYNVTLVPVQNKSHRAEFDDSWTHDVLLWLRHKHADIQVDWWVGHDVSSGQAALRAVSLAGGGAALIHHMNYVGYQEYKHDDAIDTDIKHQRQLSLFEQKAELFAVGPLLQRSCQELSSREVTQLVPGFLEIPSFTRPKSIVAVTFGRMEEASDRIKQGRLAVAGFGEAIKHASSTDIPIKSLLDDPRLYMIGLDEDWEKESVEVKDIAERHAERVVNVLALPFDHDRKTLLRRLGSANLSLMLSWHEGFGLTGWEAIAAEVPLIVTKHSGLYKLIENTLHGAGTGCIQAIDVQGRRGKGGGDNFTPEDLKAVSSAILRVSADIEHHQHNARHLKKQLIQSLGCTWGHTARQFLKALPKGETEIAEACSTGSIKPFSDRHDNTSPFSVKLTDNPIPKCAELTIGTTQGSVAESFYLLPELRFGRVEFDVDGLLVSYGVAEATLQADLDGCRIAPGTRLGDDRESFPDISAHGDNLWEIRGPKEAEVLMRRALGSEPLCLIDAKESPYSSVTLNLSCKTRNLVYTVVDPTGPDISVTEARVLEVFFNKCLHAEGGSIALGRAILTVSKEEK